MTINIASNTVERELNKLLPMALLAMGYEYIGCEYKIKRLIIYIDNIKNTNKEKQEINIIDCTAISKKLSIFLSTLRILDDLDYMLEISSAGERRLLTTNKHLKEAINKNIILTINEQKHRIKGQLLSFDTKYIVLKKFATEEVVKIHIDSVMRAKLLLQY